MVEVGQVGNIFSSTGQGTLFLHAQRTGNFGDTESLVGAFQAAAKAFPELKVCASLICTHSLLSRNVPPRFLDR